MFTRKFWKAAAERALKSGAQFVLAVLGVAVTAAGVDTPAGETVNALTWNYVTLGGAFLAGIILSVLFSIVTAAATDGSPSATDAEVLAPSLGKHRADPGDVVG